MLNPRGSELYAADYGRIKVVVHNKIAIDHPSRSEREPVHLIPGATVYTHATHSVLDWFAFSLWNNGSLIRALSLSLDHGVD